MDQFSKYSQFGSGSGSSPGQGSKNSNSNYGRAFVDELMKKHRLDENADVNEKSINSYSNSNSNSNTNWIKMNTNNTNRNPFLSQSIEFSDSKFDVLKPLLMSANGAGAGAGGGTGSASDNVNRIWNYNSSWNWGNSNSNPALQSSILRDLEKEIPQQWWTQQSDCWTQNRQQNQNHNYDTVLKQWRTSSSWSAQLQEFVNKEATRIYDSHMQTRNYIDQQFQFWNQTQARSRSGSFLNNQSLERDDIPIVGGKGNSSTARSLERVNCNHDHNNNPFQQQQLQQFQHGQQTQQTQHQGQAGQNNSSVLNSTRSQNYLHQQSHLSQLDQYENSFTQWLHLQQQCQWQQSQQQWWQERWQMEEEIKYQKEMAEEWKRRCFEKESEVEWDWRLMRSKLHAAEDQVREVEKWKKPTTIASGKNLDLMCQFIRKVVKDLVAGHLTIQDRLEQHVEEFEKFLGGNSNQLNQNINKWQINNSIPIRGSGQDQEQDEQKQIQKIDIVKEALKVADNFIAGGCAGSNNSNSNSISNSISGSPWERENQIEVRSIKTASASASVSVSVSASPSASDSLSAPSASPYGKDQEASASFSVSIQGDEEFVRSCGKKQNLVNENSNQKQKVDVKVNNNEDEVDYTGKNTQKVNLKDNIIKNIKAISDQMQVKQQTMQDQQQKQNEEEQQQKITNEMSNQSQQSQDQINIKELIASAARRQKQRRSNSRSRSASFTSTVPRSVRSSPIDGNAFAFGGQTQLNQTLNQTLSNVGEPPLNLQLWNCHWEFVYDENHDKFLQERPGPGSTTSVQSLGQEKNLTTAIQNGTNKGLIGDSESVTWSQLSKSSLYAASASASGAVSSASHSANDSSANDSSANDGKTILSDDYINSRRREPEPISLWIDQALFNKANNDKKKTTQSVDAFMYIKWQQNFQNKNSQVEQSSRSSSKGKTNLNTNLVKGKETAFTTSGSSWSTCGTYSIPVSASPSSYFPSPTDSDQTGNSQSCEIKSHHSGHGSAMLSITKTKSKLSTRRGSGEQEQVVDLEQQISKIGQISTQTQRSLSAKTTHQGEVANANAQHVNNANWNQGKEEDAKVVLNANGIRIDAVLTHDADKQKLQSSKSDKCLFGGSLSYSVKSHGVGNSHRRNRSSSFEETYQKVIKARVKQAYEDVETENERMENDKKYDKNKDIDNNVNNDQSNNANKQEQEEEKPKENYLDSIMRGLRGDRERLALEVLSLQQQLEMKRGQNSKTPKSTRSAPAGGGFYRRSLQSFQNMNSNIVGKNLKDMDESES